MVNPITVNNFAPLLHAGGSGLRINDGSGVKISI